VGKDKTDDVKEKGQPANCEQRIPMHILTLRGSGGSVITGTRRHESGTGALGRAEGGEEMEKLDTSYLKT